MRLLACAFVLLLHTSLGVSQPDGAASPGPNTTLAKWLTALQERDFESYISCLHSSTHREAEYGSRQAMLLWSRHLGDIRSEGFAGKFKYVAMRSPDDGLPAGAVRAYPLLSDGRLGRAILLVPEKARWRIIAWSRK